MGKKRAAIFEADDSLFTLWLADDATRIPLKIENSQLFGYALTLRSVEQVEQDG